MGFYACFFPGADIHLVFFFMVRLDEGKGFYVRNGMVTGDILQLPPLVSLGPLVKHTKSEIQSKKKTMKWPQLAVDPFFQAHPISTTVISH